MPRKSWVVCVTFTAVLVAVCPWLYVLVSRHSREHRALSDVCFPVQVAVAYIMFMERVSLLRAVQAVAACALHPIGIRPAEHRMLAVVAKLFPPAIVGDAERDAPLPVVDAVHDLGAYGLGTAYMSTVRVPTEPCRVFA